MNTGMDLQGWSGLEAAFKRAPEIVRQEMLAGLTEADQLLEREVKDLTPTASGLSRGSIFSREQMFGDGTGLGVVGTSQPHVKYVELGTKPHMPPVQALEDWVRQKLGVPEKRAHSVAWLVARKIAKRGTLGVGMFHRTWARRRGQAEKILAAAVSRIAARIAGAAT